MSLVISGGTPPKKQLSPELADIIGKTEASRPEIMKLLWAYIRNNKLQDPNNKYYFTPDTKMAKVFGSDKMNGRRMANLIRPHLERAMERGKIV